jgi:hypothetical protein
VGGGTVAPNSAEASHEEAPMNKLTRPTRLGLLLAAALAFAAQSSAVSATAIPYPVGTTELSPKSGSTVGGTAFVRNYAGGETHVQLRLTGLPTNGRPVIWQIHSQSPCSGPAVGRPLVAAGGALIPTRLGTLLAAELSPSSVPVTAGRQFIALRVYTSDLAGAPGVELACGELWSLPDTNSSRHSW